MKKLLFLLPAIIAFASCTKDSAKEKSADIPTIKFENNSTNASNLVACGTCPGKITVGYPISIPDGPSYCVTSSSSICGFGGGTYRTSNTIQAEGFIGSFQNSNGKLQMTVNKASLSATNRNEYFRKNEFNFDKPVYMNDVILAELKLPVPYLIKTGNYPIATENDDTFSIIF